jgi:pimeloyl-ACP methyl ester carboxylesterase
MHQRADGDGRSMIERTSRRRFVLEAAGGVAALASGTAGATLHTQGGAKVDRQTAKATRTGTLAVPGAELYYAVSGSGPVLLLIPGGFADGDSFLSFTPHVEEHYTVVRYDPRGISRSRFDGPAVDVPVETHADDARRLLEEVGDGPAFVLGSSGGGVIGLALADHHPQVVQTLVAHEPPLVQLLAEGDPRRTIGREIDDIYQQEGTDSAMAHFLKVAGLDESATAEISPEAQEAMQQEMTRLAPNIDYFFSHYFLPITDYVPDIDALQAGSARVVVGVGEESVGELAHDTAVALADRLGTPPVIFAGDHSGMFSHPEAFLAKLREVLAAD